jgi:imidazoleglycerol-phosphate dehydratase
MQRQLYHRVVSRQARIARSTAETRIELELGLDGGRVRAAHTPLPFFDHMLDAFARHGLFDLAIAAEGDLEVDAHHTVEDVGLALGSAFTQALGDRRGLVRYGAATIPMDETLVTCAVDFSGRPAFVWQVAGLDGKWVGGFDCMLAKEFFAAFATRAECNLHVLLHHGENPHHIIEACFKALARACDAATRIDPRLADQVPSTKGTLRA